MSSQSEIQQHWMQNLRQPNAFIGGDGDGGRPMEEFY
jgi:hypothetical protein